MLEEKKRLFDENYKYVTEKINNAIQKAGRDPSGISLLAATKTVPVEIINYACENGIELIGENRVQELCEKYDQLTLPKEKIHLIGHLQTNKVARVVGMVSMIESVDSFHLAQEIAKRSLQKGISTDVLVEINLGGELSKSGITPDETEEFVCKIAELKGITVRGLMAIPPVFENELKTRKFFSIIYKKFVDIQSKKIDNIMMDVLSVGMSDDYEYAILEGSTQVRVGSALFGTRVYK